MIAIRDLAEQVIAVLGGRSPQWPRVRRDQLKRVPYCEACGGTKMLTAHHVIPFHVDRSKELDPTNLMTLCEYHGCHFAFGHLYDWTAYNPFAADDALRQINKVIHQRRKRP